MDLCRLFITTATSTTHDGDGAVVNEIAPWMSIVHNVTIFLYSSSIFDDMNDNNRVCLDQDYL